MTSPRSHWNRAAPIAMFLVIAAPFLALAEPNFKTDVLPYLTANCLDCHGPDTQEGEFRIDTLSADVGIENTPQWAEVRERISSGEMPPEDSDYRPSAQQNASIVEWLAARIDEGEAARLAKRNRVTYNRLTREEYVNTVQDLIGVHFDATDPGGFLEDPQWHGLERIGSVMTLSPSNIEKYLSAAEIVLAEAYPAKQGAFLDISRRAVPPDHIEKHHRERLEKLGLLDKVRYEMWSGDIFRGAAWENLPAAGIYEISITLSGLKPKADRAPRLLVYEHTLDRILYEQDIIAAEDKPVTVIFRAHLPQGRPGIHIINDIPGPSNNFRAMRHGDKPFISTADGRMPWQVKLTNQDGTPAFPFLILDSIAWKGPFLTEQEKQHRDDYWPKEQGNFQQVRTGLRKLADRAFRRPVTNEELDAYMRVVQGELDAGESFNDSVKAGMLSILCSKSFLFITEGDEDQNRNLLNDWEIANRLSYLFWSTMPDDELFALAREGKLQDNAVLKQQVHRMLADPRSERFTKSFSRQWLSLGNVGKFPPDKNLYPDYDKSLEQSMVEESQRFFHEVLFGGHSLRAFIDSDWTVANSRLARFYELPNELGHKFEKISLPADSQRGGLLTQAAILSLTSDGTRHRPVHRGKYVLETIFGKSPPPPPANVDPIPTNPIDSAKATLRMKLEAHIHNPSCASCHRKIDPLGLAFENYDAIGRWRTHETVSGLGEDPPVNPAGQLANGKSYDTPQQFKQLLLDDIDTFNAAFIEKLATYALRRPMAVEDRDELAAIAQASREQDYRVRDIVEALVLSDLFKKR